MIEILLVFSIILGIWLVGWGFSLTPSSSALTLTGLWILAIGLIEGIPTGLFYHVILYRILGPRGRLPPGWWLSPRQYHEYLSKAEGVRVWRWFILGGLGFLLCLVGGIIAFIGMASGR